MMHAGKFCMVLFFVPVYGMELGNTKQRSSDPTIFFEFLVHWHDHKELARRMMDASKFSSSPVDCFHNGVKLGTFDNQNNRITSFLYNGKREYQTSYESFEGLLKIHDKMPQKKDHKRKCALN